MTARGWLLLAATLVLIPDALSAQGSYPLALPADGGRFTEQIRTTILSQTAGGDVHREVARTGVFTLRAQGDTLIASADSLALRETREGVARVLDTDGFVGGRFRFTLAGNGVATVAVRPFVPDEIGEVSDLTRAMDDFLPQRPPALKVAEKGSGFAGRRWERLADSAGLERYTWHEAWGVDTNRTVADSVNLNFQESSREDGAVAWDARRGPVAWHREIVSNSTARIRGQLLRTSATQRVDGRRKENSE